MGARFLLAQALALAGAVSYFASYQCRDNRRLYTVQLLSYLFYIVHFFILGAMTGGVSYLLNLARSFLLAGKWEWGHSKTMCALLCSLQLVVAAATWAGWISLLPITANIASTVGGYTHDAQKIRIAGMVFNSPLWIIYDMMIGSWVGVVDELASELSILISIRRYGWKNLKNTQDQTR